MKKTATDRRGASILVVDDVPDVLQVIAGMLDNLGYQVRTASNGGAALELAQEAIPDLVLLDINMPGMDGYEVCERLKADETLRDVPVIFVSALEESMDKVKAFGLGAVDYITKPFQIEEVGARVVTHLKIRDLQNELLRHNQCLEELVRERTGQLAEAHERLTILDRAKNEFLNLISHELRTPLNGLFGIAELLAMDDDKSPQRLELWNLFRMVQKSMLAILDDALLLTKLEVSDCASSAESTQLYPILIVAQMSATPLARSRGVAFRELIPCDLNVQGDRVLLEKAFSGLFKVAAKFSSKDPVVVSCQTLPSTIQVTLRTKGRTIPAEFLSSFFDVFAVTKSITPGGDLGLEPPMAQKIIAFFGGSVTIQNDDPPGVSFIVTLKRPEESGNACCVRNHSEDSVGLLCEISRTA